MPTMTSSLSLQFDLECDKPGKDYRIQKSKNPKLPPPREIENKIRKTW